MTDDNELPETSDHGCRGVLIGTLISALISAAIAIGALALLALRLLTK